MVFEFLGLKTFTIYWVVSFRSVSIPTLTTNNANFLHFKKILLSLIICITLFLTIKIIKTWKPACDEIVSAIRLHLINHAKFLPESARKFTFWVMHGTKPSYIEKFHGPWLKFPSVLIECKCSCVIFYNVFF